MPARRPSSVCIIIIIPLLHQVMMMIISNDFRDIEALTNSFFFQLSSYVCASADQMQIGEVVTTVPSSSIHIVLCNAIFFFRFADDDPFRSHHISHRIQRGDCRVQQHQIPNVGFRRANQHSTVLALLLCKHRCHHLRCR